jgi:uncharacterized protein (DUF362 family)
MSKVVVREFKNYEKTVKDVLDALDAKKILKKQKKIVIKPNLTLSKRPPCTTDVRCVEAIIHYINKPVVIAEASGGCPTTRAFEKLGYNKLADEYDVELVDLNTSEVIVKHNPEAFVLKKFHFPKILENCYLISVPVLKEHDWARITVSMKNMFGIVPGRFYGAGTWNKSKLHVLGVDESIVDINSYKSPDLSIVDARIGQYGNEIYGRPADPPFNIIFGGYDPMAVDMTGAVFLGHDPKKVRHLRLALSKGFSSIKGMEDIELDGEVFRQPNKSLKDRVRKFITEKAGRYIFGTITED